MSGDHPSPGAVEIPVRGRQEPGPGHISRRSALQVLASWMAMAAGLPGCVRKPPRRVISRETVPEYDRPGQAILYSSTWTEGWFPYGMVVKTVEGRPVKVDGNPDHPVNGRASNAAMQATVFSLYDPNRLKAPVGVGSWEEADARIQQALRTASAAVLLTRAALGPSEREAVKRFQRRYPVVRHLVYEPLSDRNRRVAWREVYGSDGEWIPRLDRATVVFSVGSDFLATDGAELEAIRWFAEKRDVGAAADRPLVRLYVAESELSLTGTNADHRIPIHPSRALALVQAIRAALRGADIRAFARTHAMDGDVLAALVHDLGHSQGRALVVAGPYHGAAVHAAVALLNHELGAPGRTLEWNPSPPSLLPNSREEIEDALKHGVDVLLCLGVDPVYQWPAFRELIRKARLSVAHSTHRTDTLAACHIGLPSHHNLEAWNDAEPRPGLVSLCQPVLKPLHDTRQEAESLLAWAEELGPGARQHTRFRDLVRERVLAGPLAAAVNQKAAWEEALRRGVIRWEVASGVPPTLDVEKAELLAAQDTPQDGSMALVVLPHPGTWDGRFADNPWLLEVPEPVTKQMWGNAALLGEETAADLGVSTGDVVEIRVGTATVRLPALVLPGVAHGVVAVHVGMGRGFPLETGEPAGVNVWPLASRGPGWVSGVQVSRAGGREEPVLSQTTFSMAQRPIVLDTTVAELTRDPEAVQRRRRRPPGGVRLYGPYPERGPKWGMTIDLARCVGCSACVVACQAENNIPVVGKEACAIGREMHWIRIDQYREGEGDRVKVYHQPMPCQHCDNAPCETVCPVNATNHSPDGLNQMVYNRCVGTRYCMNNCPYKVRRFNFYDWHARLGSDPLLHLYHNPDVTVRQRGVVEKCTFCVQRINAAKFVAANEGRALRDGEVTPACAEACPAHAIQFGDVRQEGSRVAALAGSRRAFQVLEELLVEPAVTYLARVWNPGRVGQGAATGQVGRRAAVCSGEGEAKGAEG